VYGTTPGGTQYRYPLAELLQLAASPLVKAQRPVGMAVIPGITLGDDGAAAADTTTIDVSATGAPTAADVVAEVVVTASPDKTTTDGAPFAME
jgi:hypothetical protein